MTERREITLDIVAIDSLATLEFVQKHTQTPLSFVKKYGIMQGDHNHQGEHENRRAATITGGREMNTRMMFARIVAGRFLDRINMINRIKGGAGR